MNGLATALDSPSDICFQAIKRSVAAPSPEYRHTTSFCQKRICEKYLTVPEPEAAQPQDLAVIGHGDDLLYWIHALACTHILPHNLRLFNLRDGGVQFDATALFNLKRRRGPADNYLDQNIFLDSSEPRQIRHRRRRHALDKLTQR